MRKRKATHQRSEWMGEWTSLPSPSLLSVLCHHSLCHIPSFPIPSLSLSGHFISRSLHSLMDKPDMGRMVREGEESDRSFVSHPHLFSPSYHLPSSLSPLGL